MEINKSSFKCSAVPMFKSPFGATQSHLLRRCVF